MTEKVKEENRKTKYTQEEREMRKRCIFEKQITKKGNEKKISTNEEINEINKVR